MAEKAETTNSRSRYGAAFDDMSSSMGIDDSLSAGQVAGDRADGTDM